MHNELLASVRAALEALDVERLLAHYTADAIFEKATTGVQVQGADELRAYFIRLFARPQVRFEVRSFFSNAESGAMEWVWSGLSNHAQIHFRIHGASLFKIAGAKIAHEIIYFDPAASLV